MNEKLIGEEGLNKGLVLSFDEREEWVIGRDPDECQLIINDPSVSRRHVLCRQTPQGLTVENLSTTNPLLLNEKPIDAPSPIKQSDTLRIGNTLFRLYLDTQVHLNEVSPFVEEEAPIDEEAPQDSVFEEETNPFADLSFDLGATGRWMLKVISGPNNGAEFSMEKGHSYLLGTEASTCDIVFHDLSVSRQHARLTLDDDESLSIEDLGSRNGTQVDGETTKEKRKLSSNSLVSLGTTAFVVIDREHERQTIVPPPLTTLGRVVQNRETLQAVQAAVQTVPQQEAEKPFKNEITPTPPAHALHALILLAIVTGLFILIGLGTSLLFRTQDVVVEKVDFNSQLDQAFANYPSLRYSFSKPTGRLLILGHLHTAADRNQLLYHLQILPFIKKIEDNVIIDEFVWQEVNQVISKNPAWKSISVSSPTPGRFIVNGFLKTRAEAEALSDYLSLNFPYPELLEKKVIVEEEISSQILRELSDKALREVTVRIENGEVTLAGNIPHGKRDDLDAIINSLKDIPGIRHVRNQVVELEMEESLINITNQYEVTGYSNIGGSHTNVVINGRILMVGDTLDGMRITRIREGTILLEKEGIKYRIDYNR